MKTIASLLAKRAEHIDTMKALSEGDKFDKKKFKDLEAEVATLDEQIEAMKTAQKHSASLARPFNGGQGGGAAGSPPDFSALDFKSGMKAVQDWFLKNRNPEQHFASLGEQLLAVRRAAVRGEIDQRLVRAPTGMGETDPSGGGFPIQVDFASTILTRAYDMGEILQRVFRLPISANANGIKIPGIDESSRVTGSRWGGVQMYWLGEGDPATASKPKFRLIELDLKKLIGVWYLTDELLQDSTALTSVANQAFAEETTFMLEDSMIHGSGAGLPLGILNAPAKVTVAKDNGQAAKTVSWNNVLNMWSRMWIRSRKNSAWFINQDIEPQLYQLASIVGTGGQSVFLPAGPIGSQASGGPFATLLGRPVIPVEYCETLGTEGDFILADFSQYVMADKNAMQLASSIHVQFLTDQTAFRLTYRVDGQPIWHAPLTPFKGSNTRSPFITLGSR